MGDLVSLKGQVRSLEAQAEMAQHKATCQLLSGFVRGAYHFPPMNLAEIPHPQSVSQHEPLLSDDDEALPCSFVLTKK